MTSPDSQRDSGETPAEQDGLDAARAALSRAQATASKQGLRPGSRPGKRPIRMTGAPVTGRHKVNRDPQLIGGSLERLLDDRGWNLDVAAGAVMGRWPELVGAQIAEHARPITFENGVLTVRAESTAWATQLGLLASSLLRGIAEHIGDGVVVELNIQGPAAPSWVRGPRRVAGRGPRDTYG